MNSEVILELFHDEEFISQLNCISTKEDIINILNDRGANIGYEDLDELYVLFNSYIYGTHRVPEDYLCNVSGGCMTNQESVFNKLKRLIDSENNDNKS